MTMRQQLHDLGTAPLAIPNRITFRLIGKQMLAKRRTRPNPVAYTRAHRSSSAGRLNGPTGERAAALRFVMHR
jgi:hypothetical protein